MLNFELIVPTPCALGESPRWDEREQILYWVDIDGHALHRYHEKDGKHELRHFDEPVACVVLASKNDIPEGIVVALKSGIYHLSDFESNPSLLIQSPEIDIPTNRFNDGRCDAAGRFIIGTVYPPKDYGGASCYQYSSTDTNMIKFQDNLMTANGIAFSPKGNYLYLSDTPRHIIYRYPYDSSNGTLGDREVFSTFTYGTGRPDGASVDSEGHYWSALFEGNRIVRLSPNGELVETLPFPCQSPTMIAFGGPDLKTLYATCVGEEGLSGLYATTVDVAGMIEWRMNV